MAFLLTRVQPLLLAVSRRDAINWIGDHPTVGVVVWQRPSAVSRIVGVLWSAVYATDAALDDPAYPAALHLARHGVQSAETRYLRPVRVA